MEIWDLYDENRNLTGETHIRGEELPEGRYHLVVHVWIRNSKGEYLISQRAADRPTFPLYFECVGGSVTAGETSIEGAIRETREEVGIDLDTGRGKIVWSKTRGVIDGRRFNDIMDVWLFEYDGDADLERATTKETSRTMWLDCDGITELYKKGILVDTLEYFFDKVDKVIR